MAFVPLKCLLDLSTQLEVVLGVVGYPQVELSS